MLAGLRTVTSTCSISRRSRLVGDRDSATKNPVTIIAGLDGSSTGPADTVDGVVSRQVHYSSTSEAT